MSNLKQELLSAAITLGWTFLMGSIFWIGLGIAASHKGVIQVVALGGIPWVWLIVSRPYFKWARRFDHYFTEES